MESRLRYKRIRMAGKRTTESVGRESRLLSHVGFTACITDEAMYESPTTWLVDSRAKVALPLGSAGMIGKLGSRAAVA